MRKSRVMLVGIVALVAILGTLGLTYQVPSANRTVAEPVVSYNYGTAAKFHAPLSAMGVAAVNLGGSPVIHGPDSASPVASPTTATPDVASIPVNGIRFINDTSYMPQSETTVAVDPSNTNHVVGGVNDARFFFCGSLPASDCPSGYALSLSGFTVSADGGHSVLKGDVLPDLEKNVANATGVPFPEVLISWGDPSIVPGVSGNFYYGSLAISANSSANGIELAVSNSNLFNPAASCSGPAAPTFPLTNPCWTATLVAGNLTNNAATFEDKDLVAVDHDPSSPYYGDAYVSWDHFNANGTTESWAARCTPSLVCTMIAGGGLPPLSGNDPFPVFTTPSVGADGAAHFTWCNYGTFTSLGPISCRVRSTATHGGALGPIYNITSFYGAGTDFPSYTGLVGFATEQFRTDAIPVIAADTSQTSNNLYFTVDLCVAGSYYNVFGPLEPGNCGESGILFSRSTNGGATWSTPVLLSTSGVNVQPWVTVDPLNGAVVVAYYTTQFDSFNHRIDVVADVSNDQGVTFHQVRVTNLSNEPDSDPAMYDYLVSSGFGGSFIVPQYGDYMQVAALGGQLWVSYTANYAVELGTFQTDPWLTLAPEDSPYTVAASATPSLTDPGVAVTFQGTATNSAGLTTFAWAFGDGTTGTGSSPTHAYALAGTYLAQVTATDGLGRQATDQASVTITTGLTAQLAAAPTATDVGQSVSFTAMPAGGTGTYTYAWTFGDGGSGSASTASHSFSATGTYTVNLWVNDSGGGSVHRSTSVTVNPVPAATASASVSALDVGQTVSFTGSSTGGTSPMAFSWDFSDGTRSAVANPAHAYAGPATYTAQLTVTDAVGVSATKTVSVTVNALPVASATASTNAPAPGASVTFTGSSTGGTGTIAYAWTFGDGATGSGQSPSHAYAAAGTYTVRVWANDTTGASSVYTMTIVVTPTDIVSTTTATIFSIAGLVVGIVIGALVMMALKRRKGNQGPQSPPPGTSP